MSTRFITKESVVVGVDGSLSSELALHWAVKEAARRGQQLHVAHALETELVVTQEFALGTKEAPAGNDPVMTAAVDVARAAAPQLETTPTPSPDSPPAR